MASVTAGVASKTTNGSDGHTVKGFYVACLHKRGYVPINARNAASDPTGELNKH